MTVATLEDLMHDVSCAAAEDPVGDPSGGDVPVGREVMERLLIEYTSRYSQAIYVSTPITTGPDLVRWFEAHPSALPHDQAAARARFRERNTGAVRPLVARVRHRYAGRDIIDPTQLEDVPGWRQVDYHLFWARVIAACAERVVLADGWQYSVGCSIEFTVASIVGLPTLDARLEVLARDSAVRMLRRASRELEAVGLATWSQAFALGLLDQGSDGSAVHGAQGRRAR